MNYITKNEIALHSFEDAISIAETLLKNNYVVMLSREENLYIVNYEWSPQGANRNDVAFISREKLEDFIFDTENENKVITY